MKTREYSSFRDPSGFVFWEDNRPYRQINEIYKHQYKHLMESGLYESLVSDGLLISHEEIDTGDEKKNGFRTIKPQHVKFISYPYEWSFGQLKDAALLTLNIQKRALEHGMILKDASAYNIQFIDNEPKLIDTLSFDFYMEGTPWVAYGQFCRHFLAPLFMMAHIDIRLSQMLKLYIDGIPLDLASKMLKGKGGFAAKQHIHWHAKSIEKHSQDGKKNGKENVKMIKISKFNLIALMDNMIKIIEKTSLKDVKTEWMDYYSATNYSKESFEKKEEIMRDFISEGGFENVWDIGANDGRFSRLALECGVSSVVSFDIDPLAVDSNYQTAKESKEPLLPLILDITNPSPGIGFANMERVEIEKRQRPDCIFALALVHHLAISNNLPLEKIAERFSQMSDNLIIEFVPKEDSQVQILLATRDDIFSNYDRTGFEWAFEEHFDEVKCAKIDGSERIMYLYRRKE